jgi:hypothetical protein
VISIGIALGPDRLVAVLPRGRTLETTDVADLRQVFVDLQGRSGVIRATVDVALIPPLADVRLLTLPPLRDEDRRRVLERDARRYFVGLGEPVVVGSVAFGHQVLAAAASAATVAEIESAVAAVGWSLGAVVPAHAAWVVGEREGQVTVRLPHGTEVLRAAAGCIVERRRFRTRPGDAAGVIDPLTLAARHASAVAGPELVSAERRAARSTKTRHVVRGLWAATAACVFLAAGLDYWGLARRLALVETRRTTLAPAVAHAMVARDSLGALADGLTTLQRLLVTSPHWSAFLADLADFLPRDAHLVELRAAGDSAVLEGVARQAAGVFGALQLMPRVAGVQAGAPIQRDVLSDGSVREHFAVNAWLAASTGRRHP